MALRQSVELTRAANLRRNLQRIFAAGPWGKQSQVARDSGLHQVQLAKLISGASGNPKLDTVESIAVALEIPVETLISAEPSDADLRIFPQTS